MIAELDEHVGQILHALEESGQAGNTLVIYASDHGEMLGEHGLWSKNALLENAARVPIIIAGPGLPRGKTVEQSVSHVDIGATVLDVAGAARPDGMRGRSLLPLALGKVGEHPGYAYGESHSEGNCTGSFMIRKGDWKYIYFSWFPSLLFNLKDGPKELNDLSRKPAHASVERELRGILFSLVKPDEVTQNAFDAQERVLLSLVRSKTAERFFDEDLAHRLGTGQARVLIDKLYRRGTSR